MTNIKHTYTELGSPKYAWIYYNGPTYVYAKFSKENPYGKICVSSAYPFIIDLNETNHHYVYLGEL